MKNQALPLFPRTPHLAGATAAGPDDVIARIDFKTLMKNFGEFSIGGAVVLEEKLDGANVRIRYDGKTEPIVGNRDKILRKGYLKDTPAKRQFRPLWGWVYDAREKFEQLDNFSSSTKGAILYGEWMYAKHTIAYDRLPDLLIGFDLWSPTFQRFLDPAETRKILAKCGFAVPPIKQGAEDGQSAWGPEMAEGIYIKIGNGFTTTSRFKQVRADFKPREDFNDSELVRNGVIK